MFDYAAERERRARRFERHLERVIQFRRMERTTDCALVFSTNNPAIRDEAASRRLTRQRSRSVASASPASAAFQDEPAVEGRSMERFVQFAFMKQTFYLDLPRTTLQAAEADSLLLRRHGYFRVRDRRWWFQTFAEWSEVVRQWNPVEKEYLNKDARSAADELAFLFYDLWRIPFETRLYWQAFAFRRRKVRDWEGTGRIN
jgi:hypothetical protein